ncbi:neutral/alkaline non-lysosomal ceramidase N-terminal domain-containing protein [Paludisphaera mucosa]|uniref:Neutral/alkaline non-lysosomal ceramidase N-terminal domain-containing protein n=1 Tax=Paludisphaera mucosa TaxID=3030827 RepID=A0ABT6FG41_9BACT|nr:neutral/alkaline non-lysosomal ceramidase N-terminal domain-containing protein [Paludisphaera mucosa]MDG3006534.1 neutral/alkaline non-lysosomal ceramidase N-terminal domain-containing protein [Paludisphaera mucosa]
MHLPFRVLIVLSLSGAWAVSGEVAVGVAKVDVTPTHPVLLAGYGHRVGEHQAVDAPLSARALAVGDADPVVLVAVENCGVPAPVVAEVRRRIAAQGGVDPSRLVVASTHTHNSPTLEGYAPLIWEGRDTPEQREHVAAYTKWLTDRLVEVAQAAVRDRKPSELSWGQGRATFGGNRRLMKDGKWMGFAFAEKAPVDHSFPALFARREGKLVAVWASYACHCTSAGSENRVGGDWAGFAATDVEQANPGATALITIGCGADVGPQPTGSLAFSRRHGRAVADEIARLATTPLKPLAAPTEVVHKAIELPLAKAPGRDHWEREARREGFEGRHAKRMLDQLDRDGKLPDVVPYEVAAWRFGPELAIVFLPGEVTVDYAVRIKREMDWTRIWINGWCNDIPGYIPSRRVLSEGGYESDFSQIYYGWPTRYDPAVEDLVVATAESLLGDAFKRTAATPEPDFFTVPEALVPSMKK